VNPSHAELLLNAVVDGVATPAQRREFEMLAANDPALRTELEQVQAMDALIAALPQIEPPAALSRAIMANVTLSRHNARPASQLSGRPAVDAVRAGILAGHMQTFLSKIFNEENFMSEVKKAFLGTTRSRVLAGGVLAIAALVVVAMQTNFPAGNGQTAGTIAPAERYRSGQQNQANVQAPGSGGTSTSTAVSAGITGQAANAANNGANAAANNGANAAAANGANAAAANGANAAAANGANAAAANGANAAANNSANNAANAVANNAANNAANNGANNAANNAANAAANNAANNGANAAANNAANNAANAAANNAANAAANNAANAAANKAANNAANKIAN
jgi:hypothetical protein